MRRYDPFNTTPVASLVAPLNSSRTQAGVSPAKFGALAHSHLAEIVWVAGPRFSRPNTNAPPDRGPAYTSVPAVESLVGSTPYADIEATRARQSSSNAGKCEVS